MSSSIYDDDLPAPAPGKPQRNLTVAEQMERAQNRPPLPDRCWHCHCAPCRCPAGQGLREKEPGK